MRVALYDALLNASAGVQVCYSHPREGVERSAIVLGDITDTPGPTVPFQQSGRKVREDGFAIAVHLVAMTPGASDSRESDVEVCRLAAIVDNILANDPNLRSLPGLIHAKLGPGSGPSPGWFDEGALSELSMSVHCLTRIS